jgi:hypothetical protein
MMPTGRIWIIEITAFLSLGCLVAAAGVQGAAHRLATATPVTATVAKVWSERAPKGGGLVYRAQLIFDRKRNDGEIVHCDVPRVDLGIHPATVGDTIKIAPRDTSCWEPDIICETCVAPSGRLALVMLIIAVISGWICFFVVRRTVREIKPITSNSN